MTGLSRVVLTTLCTLNFDYYNLNGRLNFQNLGLVSSKRSQMGSIYIHPKKSWKKKLSLGFGYGYETHNLNPNPVYFACECMVRSLGWWKKNRIISGLHYHNWWSSTRCNNLKSLDCRSHLLAKQGRKLKKYPLIYNV